MLFSSVLVGLLAQVSSLVLYEQNFIEKYFSLQCKSHDRFYAFNWWTIELDCK